MAHDDRVTGGEEDVDLPEVHQSSARIVTCGAEDDEVEVVVALDLRALMRTRRILDRQLVQAKERAGEPREVPRAPSTAGSTDARGPTGSSPSHGSSFAVFDFACVS